MSGSPLSLQRRPLRTERERLAAGHVAPKVRAGLALKSAIADSRAWALSLDPTMSSYHHSYQMSHPRTKEPLLDQNMLAISHCGYYMQEVEDRVVCSAQVFKKMCRFCLLRSLQAAQVTQL